MKQTVRNSYQETFAGYNKNTYMWKKSQDKAETCVHLTTQRKLRITTIYITNKDNCSLLNADT